VSAEAGSATPQAGVITVTNSGSGQLAGPTSTIGYTSGSGWLSQAWLAQGNTYTLTLSATAASLSAGTYVATVTIADTRATNSGQTVTVTFTVTAVAATTTISLSESAPLYTFLSGDTTPSVQTSIAGTEGGPALANLAVGTPSQAWLTASLAGNTITLTANPTGLTTGTHQATVNVTASNASNSPRVITATALVSTPTPAVGVNPSSRAFTAQTGGSNPTPQTVAITNAGTGSLTGLGTSISYGVGSGWLGVSLDTTTAPATLTITPTTGALAANTYTATVTITGTGAISGTVSVTFIVSAAPVPSLYPTPYPTPPSFATFNSQTGMHDITDPFTRPTVGYFTGTTHNVSSEAQLTTALTNAVDTDTIQITGSFTAASAFVLRDRGTAGWVRIITNAGGSLPTTRAVTPNDFTSNSVPKITSSAANRAFQVANGADRWWMDGVWIENSGNKTQVGEIGISGTQTLDSHLPTEILLTRCYFDGKAPDAGSSGSPSNRHGLAIDAHKVIVERCCIIGCQQTGSQNYAIYGNNGIGLYYINENILEAAGSHMIWGGTATSNGNRAYHKNIVWRRNFCFKRTAWVTNANVIGGGVNCWEIKNAEKVLAEGNVWKNLYVSQGQTAAVVLKAVPQNANESPWIQCWDMTFRLNKLALGGYNAIGFLALAQSSNTAITQNGYRHGNHEISDNLVSGMSGSSNTQADFFLGSGNEGPLSVIMPDVKLYRNTCTGSNAPMLCLTAEGSGTTRNTNATNSMPGLVMVDNVHTGPGSQFYAIAGDGSMGTNSGVISLCCGTAYTITNNVIGDGIAPTVASWTGLSTTNKVFSAALTQDSTGRLTDASVATLSSGGGVPGCTVTLLETAISGVEPTGTTGLPTY
jgi:hypothetical protein